jgi:hypothetical protein
MNDKYKRKSATHAVPHTVFITSYCIAIAPHQFRMPAHASKLTYDSLARRRLAAAASLSRAVVALPCAAAQQWGRNLLLHRCCRPSGAAAEIPRQNDSQLGNRPAATTKQWSLVAKSGWLLARLASNSHALGGGGPAPTLTQA